MGYTIINNSLISMVRGLPFKASLSLTSNHPSPIKAIEFRIGEGTPKTIPRNDSTGSFNLEFTEEETLEMKAGRFFYSIAVEYADGASEPKPYVGRIAISDPITIGGYEQ